MKEERGVMDNEHDQYLLRGVSHKVTATIRRCLKNDDDVNRW